MTTRLFLALACALFVVRLPSLVQPMGADQGLYAYVGERILDGALPYRDAWDQKPPAIHFTYAALRGLWPHDSVVAAADLAVAAITAVLLYRLGTALVRPVTGQVAALLFLFLSNPAFLRLGGVQVRAQAETFIAAIVAGAFLLLVAGAKRPGAGTKSPGLQVKGPGLQVKGPGLQAQASGWRLAAAGLLFGVAFTFKYNMAIYAIAGVLALLALPRRSPRSGFAALALIMLGFAIPAVAMVAFFFQRGALRDLYDATITYNLQYAGETYGGPVDAARYLLTFPVQRARVDALWLLGGAGCAVLLVASFRRRERLVVPLWVAAACAAIAINSSRGLPQYFIQAAPPLALAAAWAGTLLWTRRTAINLAAAALVAFGVWRVNNFQKLVENTWHDVRYAAGLNTRAQHLARYGEPNVRKYSAIAVENLADYLRTHSTANDRVYIFGFSAGAYVKADRVSASRFFWSRPVIAGFKEGTRGYGAAGVLADLEYTRPTVVALQQVDWLADVDNSSQYFTSHPQLGPWLRGNYVSAPGPGGFDIWLRRGSAP